jgi:hypothetical protein
MPRRTARPILELDEHGRSGYRKGCGCTPCRAGHSADVAAWRAARRRRSDAAELDADAQAQALADLERPVDPSQAPALLDPEAEPGPVEQAFTADFGGIIGTPPWKATLGALGRANARIIDQVHRHQRLDVLSGVQLRMMEILDRLRRVPGGAGTPLDIGALLGEPE